MKNRNTITLFTTIMLVLGCFGLLPRTQAVVPAPDGGYPGFNTAEGTNALKNLTTGVGNAAVGWSSLFSNTDGSYNTAVGAGTLLLNVGNQSTGEGAQNTAIGTAALLSNTTGAANTADGAFALFSNTTGSTNVAVGFDALNRNTTGDANTATGDLALYSNTTGVGNTALGFNAGTSLTTGNYNIDIGLNVSGAAGEAGTIRIGNANQTKTFIAGIRDVTTGNADAIPVLIDSAGQLGTVSSSRRFKREIKPMEGASESILGLKPVTFHYKSDKTNAPQFGLIAEEVAEVNPNLVVRDQNGEIYTVRYDAVNAMLLNEFLKEHRKVQELESTVVKQEASAAKQEAAIALQQKEIEALTAGLQKVSAQLELSKPTPQTVLNNQ